MLCLTITLLLDYKGNISYNEALTGVAKSIFATKHHAQAFIHPISIKKQLQHGIATHDFSPRIYERGIWSL